MVVDQPTVYNSIFDRTMMKAKQMVIVVYCLTIKFLRADLESARKC